MRRVSISSFLGSSCLAVSFSGSRAATNTHVLADLNLLIITEYDTGHKTITIMYNFDLKRFHTI